MNSKYSILTSREKALKLNLQPSIYGVFAEIGAGQEVSNHFYKAGAASGTVAKSICAYDMMISDSVYGSTTRYVSKDRLENMLNVEYQNLISSIPSKAAVAHFFAYANTIETTSFQKSNKGQGWMGIKFQTSPNSRPITINIHIVLHTSDVLEQQELIGVLGVNLIYAAYENFFNSEQFIKSLKDNIATDKLEINFIEVSGNNLPPTYSKELSLLLVKHNLTKMVMIGSNGEILQPLNALYKKDAVLVRGRFNPPTKVTLEMFDKAIAHIQTSYKIRKQDIIPIAEITFNCYQEKRDLTIKDFLNRTEVLSAIGYPILVTNFQFHHELISFMNQFVQMNSLHLVLGMDNLQRAFAPGKGQTEKKSLELIQALIHGQNRILCFPELNSKGRINTLNDLFLDQGIGSLVTFLKETGRIEDIPEVNIETLSIRSNKVVDMLVSGNDNWKPMVPAQLQNVLESKRPIYRRLN